MGGHRMTLRTTLALPAAAVGAALFLVVLPAATAPAQAQTAQAQNQQDAVQAQVGLKLINLSKNVPDSVVLEHYRNAIADSVTRGPVFALYINGKDPNQKELNDLYFRTMRGILQRRVATLVVIDSSAHSNLSLVNQIRIEGKDVFVLPFAMAFVDKAVVNNVTTTLVTKGPSGKSYETTVTGIAIQGKAGDKVFVDQLIAMTEKMANIATAQFKITHPSSPTHGP